MPPINGRNWLLVRSTRRIFQKLGVHPHDKGVASIRWTADGFPHFVLAHYFKLAILIHVALFNLRELLGDFVLVATWLDCHAVRFYGLLIRLRGLAVGGCPAANPDWYRSGLR
jgi:hypothetical protein